MTEKQKELYDAILKKELAAYLTKNLAYNIEEVPGPVPTETGETRVRELDLERRTTRIIEKKEYVELDEDDLITIKKAKQTKSHKIPFYIRILFINLGQLLNNQSLNFAFCQLRKVCNHPDLFHLSSDHDLEKRNKQMLEWSGKMLLLDRLLSALIKSHKVLIFSQMTAMLDIIEDWLFSVKDYKYCRIDGNVGLEDRREEIKKFNEDCDIRVFLLSTRAGGLGINLTTADTVIIYDSDWVIYN